MNCEPDKNIHKISENIGARPIQSMIVFVSLSAVYYTPIHSHNMHIRFVYVGAAENWKSSPSIYHPVLRRHMNRVVYS